MGLSMAMKTSSIANLRVGAFCAKKQLVTECIASNNYQKDALFTKRCKRLHQIEMNAVNFRQSNGSELSVN